MVVLNVLYLLSTHSKQRARQGTDSTITDNFTFITPDDPHNPFYSNYICFGNKIVYISFCGTSYLLIPFFHF